MAAWQAEISIETFRTKLSCKVLISYIAVTNDGLGDHLWWQKIAGRYNFGPDSGKWAYFRSGIILSRTTDMNNPLVKEKVNHLLVLNDVPTRFAEKVSPGNFLVGTGYHYMTNGEIGWEMRFPTVPIKK
jgi:hypothetical protein